MPLVYDKTARLWDVASGQLKATLQGHTESVVSLVFSPDRRTLATVSDDDTARIWDLGSGQAKAVMQGHEDLVEILAFSPDGKMLATESHDNTVRLWDVSTGRQVPIKSQDQLSLFPPQIQHPLSASGAAVSLHDPRDGRVLVTMLSMPQAKDEAVKARPISIEAKATSTPTNEYLVTTPEGYFDCTENAARYLKWNVNGVLYPAERYLRRFRRPDLVRKALRGEKIEAPEISGDDIPPKAHFVDLKSDDTVTGDFASVSVDVFDDRGAKEVELYVNGRPLSQQSAKPIGIEAKPISIEAKQIDPNYNVTKRFTYRMPLPRGAHEIRLRAIAYDDTDLGSDPAEIVLKRSDARPVAGDLYVLSVGVSKYKNGSDQLPVTSNQFKNLTFPAIDAQSIAERFQKEGKPLYEKVVVRTLLDERATVPNVREGLKWLQQSCAGHGRVDTVVIFLSGHGVSSDEGRYAFATYEIEVSSKDAIARTSLSGKELREALGGNLDAKAVFLFVDTCHSGGLQGRNTDLAIDVGEGVFIVASSGASQYSYESAEWGHGAFTLALLRTLAKKDLEDDGAIRFSDLISSVRREVKSLLKATGQNESQEPVVPLAGRSLGQPLAQARS